MMCDILGIRIWWLTSTKGTSEVHGRSDSCKVLTNKAGKMVEAAGVELIRGTDKTRVTDSKKSHKR